MKKRIVLFANLARADVSRAVEDFRKWLGERVDVRVVPLDKPEADADCDGVAAAVVFGGDGSLLRAARRLHGCEVPVIGVNMGRLGFLVELSAEELREGLDDILSGRHKPVPRIMLQAVIERAAGKDPARVACNDVVLRHALSTRMITFCLSVDGKEAVSYNGDGLIISSPMGSTAYSLSAGGPILQPDIWCIVATPICPHALANRSIVLNAESVLRLTLPLPNQMAQLTFDGQETITVQPGETVVVTVSPHPLWLVENARRSFFQTLREKMNWEGHPNYGK